jgi:putative addiction module component (TIGR02574 family)
MPSLSSLIFGGNPPIDIRSLMHNTRLRDRRNAMKDENEFMTLAESLPFDMKVRLVERLLLSMNAVHPEVDAEWADEVERRAAEIESGKVKTIPGSQVFQEIRERLSK